jgi:hypothetical protein
MALLPQIDLDFGDGAYTFALPLPQLIQLEDTCATVDSDGIRRRKGVVAIYADVLAGLTVEDGEIIAIPHIGRASGFECREVVRLGLIGGGAGLVNELPVKVDSLLAEKLCKAHVDTAPLVKRWTMAAAILRAAIEGYEPPKKAEAGAAPAAAKRRKSRSKSGTSSSTAG